MGVVPAVEILRMLTQRALKLSAAELRLDALDDACCDVVLYHKHVAETAIVLVCPNLRLRACVDKLNGDSNFAAHPAHAALEKVACAKLLCRRHGVAVLLLTEQRRVACENGKSSPA